MDTSVWTTLITTGGVLCAALGTQILAAGTAMRARRLDIYWQAKSSAYKGLLERLGEFASYPTDEKIYFAFLAAYETALVVASDEVAELLRGPTGISVTAQRLRLASTAEEHKSVAFTTWYDATKAVSDGMRNDLKRLSGGLQ
jgi:hypothetical protein